MVWAAQDNPESIQIANCVPEKPWLVHKQLELLYK